MLATLSVLRYTAYNARMFDLGHMTQAIWSSVQGRPLEFSYHGKTISRLALHAELVYFFLTPLYALFPSPITLLIVQTVLFGAGAFPLHNVARRHIDNVHAARAVTVIYLFYPSAQMALLFDFHGDTLAMPLLLFVFDSLDREAWFEYRLWVLLVLSCKVYLAVPVAAIGVFIWLKGHSRVGKLTLLGAGVWGATLFLVVRPLFSAVSSPASQVSMLGYIEFYYSGLIKALTVTGWARLLSAFLVFAPVLPFAIYAVDWFLLALIVATPVLLSSGPGPSFGFLHHRYAMVVPFISMLAVHATARLQYSGPSLTLSKERVFRLYPVLLGTAVLTTLLFNMRFVSTPLRPWGWSEGFEEGGLWEYKRTSRDRVKDQWLRSNVPDEAPLLASVFLAPHLANRHHLHVARPLDGTVGANLDDLLNTVDYAVLDGLFDHIGFWLGGDVTYDWELIESILQRRDYGLVSSRDGLLMFKRRVDGTTDDAWAGMTLSQSVVVSKTVPSTTTVLATFTNLVDLSESSVVYLGNGRYRFQYIWVAREGITHADSMFAVTDVMGIEGGRILHLPTTFIHPTTDWLPGERIIETFEVELPTEVSSGPYVVSVGWYDGSLRSAYATDVRSRIGDLVPVAVLDVTDVLPTYMDDGK
jgi:uncharacterized membrane protein